MKRRVELERVTGQALTPNNISVDEAYQGTVAKPADPLPPNAGLEESEDDSEATDAVAGPDQAALNLGVGPLGSSIDQPSSRSSVLTREDSSCGRNAECLRPWRTSHTVWNPAILESQFRKRVNSQKRTRSRPYH